MEKRVLTITLVMLTVTLPLLSQRKFTPRTPEQLASLRNLAASCRKPLAGSNRGTQLDDAYNMGYCIGYVRATMAFIGSVKVPDQVVCFPQNVIVQDVQRVIVKYADDHPEKLQEPDWQQVFVALFTAYPCKQPGDTR